MSTPFDASMRPARRGVRADQQNSGLAAARMACASRRLLGPGVRLARHGPEERPRSPRRQWGAQGRPPGLGASASRVGEEQQWRAGSSPANRLDRARRRSSAAVLRQSVQNSLENPVLPLDPAADPSERACGRCRGPDRPRRASRWPRSGRRRTGGGLQDPALGGDRPGPGRGSAHLRREPRAGGDGALDRAPKRDRPAPDRTAAKQQGGRGRGLLRRHRDPRPREAGPGAGRGNPEGRQDAAPLRAGEHRRGAAEGRGHTR